MAENLADYLGTTALAVGALGAAAYGVVDGLKLVPWVDLAGFERLFSGRAAIPGRAWIGPARGTLDPLLPALVAAYGQDVMQLIKAQYRAGRSGGDLPRTLRQGVRIGFGLLPAQDIAAIAERLGLPAGLATFVADAFLRLRELRPPASGEIPRAGDGPSDEERAALARLENAIDARIDAALGLAERQYVTQTKLLAMLVALAIAFGVGLHLGAAPVVCFMVGIAAVPLAPVAKDLATALQAAVQAFRGRGG
ncbi:hypothetical protein [Thiobacter aerophilum]|uniref:DUF445 family protein n=1 Tax=Thiobacter aerophilum TaxID=3121275 RepID=A0ABV0EE81_9BURK